VCGDGHCDLAGGESRASCIEDCAVCGDGACDAGGGEDTFTCAEDCVVCGDARCDAHAGEDRVGCPEDCAICGDGECDPGGNETRANCAQDCAVCDDGHCDAAGGEDRAACPEDCAVCGDGHCDPLGGEDAGTCADDCWEQEDNDDCADAYEIVPQNVQEAQGDTSDASGDFAGRPGRLDVWYRFSLAAPQDVDLLLESNGWDCFLYLLQGTCGDWDEWVHNDDDNGNTSRSRIIEGDLPAGDYLVVVTAYGANSGGPFTLTGTFEGGAVCGDGFCDHGRGESPAGCPDDCPDLCGGAQPPVAGDIRITEVLLDPSVFDPNGDNSLDSGDDEYIELANVSGRTLALESMRLFTLVSGDDALTWTFPPVCLPPRSGLVLFGGGIPALQVPSAQILAMPDGDFLGLNNSGENIRRESPVDHAVIDAVEAPRQLAPGMSWTRDPGAGDALVSHPLEERPAICGDDCPRNMSPGRCSDGRTFAECVP